jgi:hypothetical protein
MKYALVIIFNLFAFWNISYPQSFNVDASIATDSKNTLFIYNFSPGIGYCFTDKDYIFGGVKYQVYNLIPKYDRVEDDLWSTNTIHNLLFYTGVRYLLPTAKIKKDTDNEFTIGFIPEFKVYLNPYVPRRLKYINSFGEERSAKGDYNCQVAYSLGFGVYFEPINSDMYFALNFEYCNIDAFKTIKQLKYEGKTFNFPNKEQYSIGFSFFFW